MRAKRPHFPKELRARVIALDGGACQICGFTIALNIHHVVSVADGGLNQLRNLVTLCPNHHAMAHLGLIDPEQFCTDPEERPDLSRWRGLKTLLEDVARTGNDPAKIAALQAELPARMEAMYDAATYRAAYTVFIQWRDRLKPNRDSSQPTPLAASC